MTQEFDAELAKEIVSKILTDFTDRRGLRQQWEQIDAGIQKEITEAWEEAALSVITPHYEKQIAELKAQIPQWQELGTAPKYDITFLCRRKASPCIVFEAMITQDQDGWENPVYDVLVNTTYENDILDDSWDCYEWMLCPPKTAESEE